VLSSDRQVESIGSSKGLIVKVDVVGNTVAGFSSADSGDQIEFCSDHELTRRVDDTLADFLDSVAPRLAELEIFSIGPYLGEFLASRGKRLRPIYAFYGAALAGTGTVEPELVSAATALELFHAFALIHDDVMDDSTMRRGEPTLLCRYTAEAARAHDPDPRATGRNLAVLAGDLVLCWAEGLFRESVRRTPHADAALTLFAEMQAEIMVGQALDICHERRIDHITPGLTSRIIEYKTSRYTFLRPLQIGAALGGADEHTIRSCADIADPLGRAFQLRDDLVGAFGASAVIGKSGSADLESGKATELLRLTMEAACPSDAEFLRRHLGHGELAPDDLARARAILLATGAYERTLAEIHRSVAEAHAVLRVLDCPDWLSARIDRHLRAMSQIPTVALPAVAMEPATYPIPR
jgi:geranylgeranyl diphosphate synthase type I